MKIIKRQAVIYQDVYIADDGTEFLEKDECLNHDKHLNEVQSILSKLYITEDLKPCNGYENSNDFNYLWYKVNNSDEFNIIKTHFNLDNNVKESEYPDILCVQEPTYDGDEIYASWFSEHNVCLRKIFDKLGFDITITERKN